MKNRNVSSPTTGSPVPVTVDLKVNPLIYNGKPVVNGNGRQMLDDEWIYVNMPYYGNISINVNRANFCQKVYLSNIKIKDSIGGKNITKRLDAFIEKISDKLVFTYNGISYRIYLKQINKNLFDIEKVWPYWATVCTGGIMSSWNNIIKKYGSHPGWDYHYENGIRGKHKLDVDINKVFNIE